MSAKRYRKKPIVVEAMQITDETISRVLHWASAGSRAITKGDGETPFLEIHTLEGIMIASPGDYIIKGVSGEFYPCKPDIFEATYERAEQQPTAGLMPESPDGANKRRYHNG